MGFIVAKQEPIQYDGTNGTTVAGWVTGNSLVSDNGTTLVVSDPIYGNLSFTANDHWLIRTCLANGNHAYGGQMANSEFQNIYTAI